MCFRHKTLLTKVTLFFFVVMVCVSPAMAQQDRLTGNIEILHVSNNVAISYVTPHQVDLLIQESQRRGYTVHQGTLQQLAELEQNEKITVSETDKKPACSTDEKKQDTEGSAEEGASSVLNNCVDAKQQNTQEQSPQSTEVISEPFPPPEHLPPPQPAPQTSVHTNVGIYADVSYGSGGGSSDAGKVFFIVAGFMVIAAFIVYAGKYISDLVSGKDVKVWWEFIFSNSYLNTRSGQHGRLNGLKVATGFVSSDLIQVALVGEVGNTDINLIINENTNPDVLDFSATYWMLGATARLHLTDKLVNASYLYLDFLGGQTDHGSTDFIGMARLGASFGVNDYLRLGASIGSFYIDLDEDQGFANDGDNYWTTFGFEIGVKF